MPKDELTHFYNGMLVGLLFSIVDILEKIIAGEKVDMAAFRARVTRFACAIYPSEEGAQD